MPIALMLHPKGIGVADAPPEIFAYGNQHHASQARTFVPYIEMGLPDEEAWAALFDDQFRLQVFRSIHGNCTGRRRAAA